MSTDPTARLRDIEIDSGVSHDAGATCIRLTLRELDGLRRTLGEVTLSAEHLVALARGGTVRTIGLVPVEFTGGDALVDALDRATSGDGKLSPRAPAQIAETLLSILAAGFKSMGGDRAMVPFDGTTAIRRALRGTRPRTEKG